MIFKFIHQSGLAIPAILIMWGSPLACRLRCLWLRKGVENFVRRQISVFSPSLLIMRIAVAILITGVCLWSGLQAQGQQQRTGAGSRGTTGGASGSRSGSSGSSGTRDYNNNTMVGDATISSDLETRRLIVVTDEETAVNISQVISNLDRPKPQVLIKVVFLEVTHNDDLDLGLEASYTKNIGGSITQPGNSVQLTNLFGLVQQGASGGSSMPYGAGLYSITGNDFQATLRAIASKGKTEILSRPSIMVRNNQPATILVGESIPIISGTTFNSVGGQNSTYTYRDVGIQLQVTPFITSDGLVQLIVAPSISDLTDQSITVATGVNIPVISMRSANTVVVTPDRQTIVIGGLMAKGKKALDTKVPLLGDIPWLGYLFKRHTVYDTKTEVVIFLTPYVVRSPGELAASTKSETDRIEMIPKAFSEKDLDKYLEGMPMKKPETKGEKK